MPWLFGSFLVTSRALKSCHVVISKQGSRVHTGDENHAVRFGQSAENQSRAWDTPSIRVVSAYMGVKTLAPQAPGKRYRKKKSSLWVYVSPSISQLTTNWGAFSRIKREIYFDKEVCFVRSLNCVNRGYTTPTGDIGFHVKVDKTDKL